MMVSLLLFTIQANGLVIVNKLPAVLVSNKLPIVSTTAIEVSANPSFSFIYHILCIGHDHRTC